MSVRSCGKSGLASASGASVNPDLNATQSQSGKGTKRKHQEREVVPDGRKCDCCPATDDSFCPVMQILFPLAALLRVWGYPPVHKGGVWVNQGSVCAFCLRIWESLEKHKKKKTLKIYKLELGSSKANYDRHQLLLAEIIKYFIKHESVDVRVPWGAISESVLVVIDRRSAAVLEPEDEWWGLDSLILVCV